METNETKRCMQQTRRICQADYNKLRVMSKLEVRTGPMTPILPKDENDLVAVDVFGPLSTSFRTLVVLNVFTKYVKLYPLGNPTAHSITKKNSIIVKSENVKEFFQVMLLRSKVNYKNIMDEIDIKIM